MQSRSRFLLRASLLALGLAAGIAFAQSPVGALAGKAEPGAVAVITNPTTGMTREVTVGKKGRYQLRNLPIGRYDVAIRHADGRVDAPKPVQVQIGITVRVP